MRETFRRLTRMSVGYGLVQWAGPVLSFLLMPILTRILEPADYGVADYIATVASAVGVFAALGVPQALTAHFNDRPDDEWRRQVTGSALAVTVVSSLIAGVALLLLSPMLAASSFGNQAYTPLYRLVAGSLAFGMIGGLLTTAAQAALRVRWGMAFSLTTILGTVLGNVLFIVVLRRGVTGLILTPTVTSVAVAAVAIILTVRMIGRPSKGVVSLLLRSGLLLLPALASGWVLQLVDRLFLVHYVSTTELGYYAIANKLTSLLFVALSPFYTAWTPLALSMRDDPQVKERYVAIARVFVGTVLAAALVLSLFATEFLLVFARRPYLPAAPYVGILAYAQVFGGIGALVYTGALANKQFRTVSWTAFVGAGVNLVLNFWLIPRYGVWGATIATVVGMAIPQVLLYIWVQRKFPVPYPTAKLLGAMGLQFVLVMAGLLLPPFAWPLRVAVKLGFVAILLAAYLRLRIITPLELHQAADLIGARVRRMRPSR